MRLTKIIEFVESQDDLTICAFDHKRRFPNNPIYSVIELPPTFKNDAYCRNHTECLGHSYTCPFYEGIASVIVDNIVTNKLDEEVSE